MMGARNIFYCVSAFIIAATGWICPVYAVHIHIYGGDFDLRIPEEPGENYGKMADAIIDIQDDYIISDLNVKVNISHSNVFDLQVVLINPSGTPVCLNMYGLDDFFEGPNYIDTIFDDEALVPIEEGEAPFTGRFRPRDSLSVFDGESIFGEWRLHIVDQFPHNWGRLDSFELLVSAPEPATVFLLGFGSVFMLLRNSNRRFKKH
jgi:hypothetical protein